MHVSPDQQGPRLPRRLREQQVRVADLRERRDAAFAADVQEAERNVQEAEATARERLAERKQLLRHVCMIQAADYAKRSRSGKSGFLQKFEELSRQHPGLLEKQLAKFSDMSRARVERFMEISLAGTEAVYARIADLAAQLNTSMEVAADRRGVDWLFSNSEQDIMAPYDQAVEALFRAKKAVSDAEVRQVLQERGAA